MRTKTKSFLLKICAGVMSCLALVGMNGLFNVSAESKDFAVADLVTLSNATATAASTNATAGYTGLAVSSATAYSGAFNAEFTGDNEMEFRFPGEKRVSGTDGNAWKWNPNGQFTFKVAEKDNESNYFEVIYAGTASNCTTVHVKYNDQVRTRNSHGGNYLKECKHGNQGIVVPGFNSDVPSTTCSTHNYFGLRWNEDVLQVYARLTKNFNDNNTTIIAEFDGTENVVDQTSWGLPKLEGMKTNGYTISFSSNYEAGETDKGTDITFLSLNGVALNGETVSATKGTPVLTYDKKQVAENEIYVPQGVTLGTFELLTPLIVGDQTKTATVFTYETLTTPEVDTNRLGTHKVTVDGAELNVCVVMGTQQLVTLSNATATAASKNATAGYTGLAVSSATAYSGAFNAEFTGDNEMEFRFPGEKRVSGTNGDCYGQFTFKVAEKDNESNYFEVIYAGTQSNCTTVHVKYNDQVRTRNTAGGDYLKECKYGNQGIVVPGFNSDSYTGGNINYFGLRWNGDVLQVYARLTKNFNDNNTTIIAAFDGTNKVETNTSWGLPKLEGMKTNGYSISFSSNYEAGETDKGTDITFLSLNGVALKDTKISLKCTSAEVKYDGNLLSNNAVISIKKGGVLGDFSGRCYYSVGSASVYNEGALAVDLSGVNIAAIGEYPITFVDQSFTVLVSEEGETVTYPQGKALGSSVRLDKNGWRFGLALSKTEYESLTSTYGDSYDIGFAVTKNGTTKYQSVKAVTWADITIDGQEYKYAVFTITGVPESEFKTEISYNGYFELDGIKVSITETVVRTFDDAIRTAYERGDTEAKAAIVNVYGSAYEEN